MRKYYLLLTMLLVPLSAYLNGQCTPTEITPKSNWSVFYVDSEETAGEGNNNGHAIHAIDNYLNTFWHTQWQGAQPGYPHEIQLNLGSSHDVAGISVTSRNDNPFGKPKDYIISLSTNGSDWVPQSIGQFQFPNVNQGGQKADVFFGAVSAQYVKIEFLTPYGNDYYTVLAEIDVYEDLTCPATGQNNQLASFEEIPKKYTTDAPFTLEASTNSGLDIDFEVVSGPATLSGNVVTLNGTGGVVTVKASQAGNNQYYPWESTHSFDVIDLTQIQPEISVRFTENQDVKMAELDPYKLYAYAVIDESEVLSITSVEYEIDGETHLAELKNGAYQYWWTPSQYGNNNIKVKATASNGMVKTETYNLNVSNSISNLSSVTFDGDVIDMGTIGSQWFYGSYELPQFVAAYDTILADFQISCPNVPGGCDDWDRLGWVDIKAPDGSWVELFRYITPYGVACDETIDVTDFASLLQGKVEFRMYIETWGTGGWKLDLSLDYLAGTPEYKYSHVQELWHGNFPFGNPANLQPMETVQVYMEPGVEDAKLRLVTTGHGWGANNTSNAAEFYHAYHNIQVNQSNTFVQDLWQTCNPNPAGCTGQMGTWQYNRAGWCPGSMGKLYFYDLSPFIAQESISLDYRFQSSYVDKCHPNHPDCVSGSTCADCNDSYNPNYQIGGYVIKYSNLPLVLGTEEQVELKELKAALYPNPSNGTFRIQLNSDWTHISTTLFDVTGRMMQTRFFNNEQDINKALFDIRSFPAGTYFIKVNSEGKFVNLKVIKK